MISEEMRCFLEAEIKNCTAGNGSGEPATLFAAQGSLSQMDNDTLSEIVGTDPHVFDRQGFNNEFRQLIEAHGGGYEMRDLL